MHRDKDEEAGAFFSVMSQPPFICTLYRMSKLHRVGVFVGHFKHQKMCTRSTKSVFGFVSSSLNPVAAVDMALIDSRLLVKVTLTASLMA